jgi:hypothetical protein
MAGGVESDEGLARRGPARTQRPEQLGVSLSGGRDGEARADGFTLAIEDGDA